MAQGHRGGVRKPQTHSDLDKVSDMKGKKDFCKHVSCKGKVEKHVVPPLRLAVKPAAKDLDKAQVLPYIFVWAFFFLVKFVFRLSMTLTPVAVCEVKHLSQLDTRRSLE